MRSRSAALLISGAFAAVAGCGSDDSPEHERASTAKATPTETATPTPTPDPRPRVEGAWRVVFTPRDPEMDPDRVNWTITSRCAEGACGGRIQSSTGRRFKLTFDEAIGDYGTNSRGTSDCVNLTTNELIFKNAYKNRTIGNLAVTQSVKTEDGEFATEMFGEWRTRSTMKPAAEGTCDPAELLVDDVRAVRKDAPEGEPGSVGLGEGVGD
jgi:hypothetical protein